MTMRSKWLLGLPVLAALLALLPAAPAHAQYDPPKQVTLSPAGVDFTRGHFHHKTVDLAIGPFKLERSYASGGPIWGSNQFGSRWTHNYSVFVYRKDTASNLDDVLVVMGRDVVHFTTNGYTGGFSCWNPDCAGATLKYVGSALVYTDLNGTVYTFNPAVSAFTTGSQTSLSSQRIANVEHPDGHTSSFGYTGSRLTQISSNYGYSLIFEYSALGYITKACVYNRAVTAAASDCSSAASSVTYQYGPNGDNLVNVVDLMGQDWGYAYPTATTAANLTCVKQVNSSSCRIANAYSAAPGSVSVQQTTADSAVWTTTVNRANPDDPQLPGEPPPYSDATFSGPEGISAVAVLGGGLLETYHENGRTTHLTWNGIELDSLAHHEGNKISYARLGPLVLGETWTPKPGSGLSPISWSMLLREQQGTSCATAPKICHKPVWRKDYKSNQTDFEHDPAHGGVLTETGPLANGVRPQKRYSYVERTAVTAGWAAAGRTIWVVDRMAFCRTGNPNASNTGCALGSGDEVVTTYDYGPASGPNNLQLRGTAVTADGTTLRTCFGYDSLGRKISETSPMGTTALSACPAGPPTAALPYTTSTRYDSASRVTGTIAPDPDGPGSPLPHPAVRNTYDKAGRLTKVEKGSLSAWHSESVAPAHWTGFTVATQVDTDYDVMGRKVREVSSGGGITAGVTEYGYDLAGRLKCTAVRMNRDVWANPLTDKCVGGTPHAVDGPDRITRNHYDPLSQVTRIETAVGTPLQQVYASYTYSPNGKRTSVTDANGNKAEMTYDGLDRQKRWIFPSKTAPGSVDPSDYEEYGYDSNANRASLRKRDGSTLAYQYDALNRMTVKIVPERTGLSAAQTRDVHYEYDNRGLQTKARFDSPAGEGVTNDYDGLGRLSASTMAMGGASRTISYQYDLDGNRKRITHPPSIVPTHPHLGLITYYFDYHYDGLGRLVSASSGGGTLGTWTYDAQGRLEKRSRMSAPPTVYTYDPASRPIGIAHDLYGTAYDQTLGFTYNPASQIHSRSSSNDLYAANTAYDVVRPYSSNGLNQYISAGPAAFAYDLNGNLTSDGASAFVYDVENRLVSASGAKNAALVYDPLGRLFQVSGGATPLQFLYDGDALTAEYQSADTRPRIYVHAIGTDVPFIWFEGGSAGRGLYADHQGSIVAAAHPTNGFLAINAYDPWGIPNAGNQGRFGYTGQAWIPELGMWYYKARFYSPTVGRFLQVDPIGYDDQVNLYAYVGNDPVNRTDPTGKCSSIKKADARADCSEKREIQVQAAKAYLKGESIKPGSDEAAYIAIYNENTGEVSVRTGDKAGIRSESEVLFTDSKGKQLRAQPDGRIVERGDGPGRRTNEVVLTTGHGHTKENPGGRGSSAVLDRANDSIRSNFNDQRLSTIAPAVIKGTSGEVRVYVNGKEVE